MEPSICIEMIYPELSYEERIEAVARCGFRYIEFWSWKDKDPVTVQQALQRTGIRVSNYSGQRKGDLIREEQHPLVEMDLQDALRYQRYFSSPTLMVLAQELGEQGRVVRPIEKEAGEKEIEILVKGIIRLLTVVEREDQRGTTLVFEPLNTRLDHPGYAISSMETAERIYQLVLAEYATSRNGRRPDFGILLDLYHQGMSGDDLLSLIPRYLHCVRYIHVADVPGRGEPGSGTVDWLSVLRTLQESGYDGFVGFEFQPSQSSDRALERIADLWSRLR
ncbi:MAG: TIM barrel protein [Spirochaetes bacterium]|nr:TIM barrel protein [Spirochaetota bacterium]